MKNNRISLVISAPSGAGKTTLIRRLLTEDNRFEFSVSTTTRPSRGIEEKGKNYNFVSEEEFKEMIDAGQFVEWALVHGNYYGTTKKEIDRITDAEKIPVFDVDVQGARILKNAIRGAVYIFIVPPSMDVLEKRLRDRKTDSEEQIGIRLNNSIEELKQYGLYDYIVVNEDMDQALSCIMSIVSAEMCKKERASGIIKFMLKEKES